MTKKYIARYAYDWPKPLLLAKHVSIVPQCGRVRRTGNGGCRIDTIRTLQKNRRERNHPASRSPGRIVSQKTHIGVLSEPHITILLRQGAIMSKRVLIIVSNACVIGPNNRRTGNFLPEVAHPYAEFSRAKYQIDFASLSGDTPYLDALNLAADPENLAFLTGNGWAWMQKARRLSGVGGKGYDGILVSDGSATIV